MGESFREAFARGEIEVDRETALKSSNMSSIVEDGVTHWFIPRPQEESMEHTAREQARGAVRAATGYPHGNYDRYADAASDVWEPLLKDAYALLSAVFAVVGHGGPPVEGSILWRIKEALGL